MYAFNAEQNKQSNKSLAPYPLPKAGREGKGEEDLTDVKKNTEFAF